MQNEDEVIGGFKGIVKGKDRNGKLKNEESDY